MNILTLEQFIAEGAGAGYKVKFEGLEFDFQSAAFTGERTIDDGKEYWKITMDIKCSLLKKWSTEDYYYGISSDGNDNFFIYDSDDDFMIHDGSSVWWVYKHDFLEYIADKYNVQVNEKLNIKPITASKLKSNAQMVENIRSYTEYLQRFLQDECDEIIDFEFNYGGGWAHSDLPNPIVLGGGIDNKDCPLAEYTDYYSNVCIFCSEMRIDCENIVKDINYFYKYAEYSGDNYDTYYDEDSGMEFLQISDEPILQDVFSNYTEEEYKMLCNDAIEKLKNKYNTEFYLCGRSGRHVCVDDTLENRERLDEMKSDVKAEQKNIINTLNSR